MALKTNIDLKQFYSIKEVAEMFGVTETLLRYWEKEFPQISPRKSGRQIRQYRKEDIEQIKIIYNLLKVRGLKIAAAREVLRKNKQGIEQSVEVVDKLKNIRAELVALRDLVNGLE